MIDVREVLKDLPHFETFCSVEKLQALAESLRSDPRFQVEVAGKSTNGRPIHHVRYGTGSVKALFVAGPHAPEPIGNLTVFSLMRLLQQGNRALLKADVEWHIVPCIDPDGAILNEPWTQHPVTLQSLMRNHFVQQPRDQVDVSFPLTHKKLVFNEPCPEARVLQGVLDRVRPDFFFSLHNSLVGGVFYLISRDVGRPCYEQIYEFLNEVRFPLEKRSPWRNLSAEFSEGISETFAMKKYYDYLEQTSATPEKVLEGCGASSCDYLSQIKPEAVSFVAEMGVLRHPDCGSEQETGENLRRFKLHVDAESKYVASVMLEEWEKVREEVNTGSPFYPAVIGGALPKKDKLAEGGIPLSPHPTAEILSNPEYAKTMTRAEKFLACIYEGGYLFLIMAYQLVRLLKDSKQTPAIRQSIARLEKVFDEALAETARHVNLDAFENVECDALARVQLGSGLIVLNSILARR